VFVLFNKEVILLKNEQGIKAVGIFSAIMDEKVFLED